MSRIHLMLALVLTPGLALCKAASSEPPKVSLGNPKGSFFALLVPNADESARWYQDNLGFAFVRKTTAPDGAAHTIMLKQEGVLIEIIEHRDAFGLQEVTGKSTSMLRGIRKVGFTVRPQEFDRIFRHLQQHQAQFRSGIFEDEGLAVRSFIVLDNNANLVQLFARLDKK